MKRVCLSLIALLVLSSCAHVISQDLRSQALDVPFEAVRANVLRYNGSIFIWGGFIVETKTQDGDTWVEVVQNPIDRQGNVINTDVSGGRFLARYKGYLDPLIYEAGRKVTVAGVLQGSRKKSLDGADYLYPVLEVLEIYLWQEEKPYYYEPYYYDPYYDPFYYDPFFRHRRPYPYWRYDPWWRYH